MTVTRLTISDYLAIEEIYEGQQEFVDGEIIKMPPESNLNAMISVLHEMAKPIASSLFPELNLTVEQLLQAGGE